MGPKRRNEMWTSNNRVLNGGYKKMNGRNPNFDTEETKLLISLWGDPKVQKTLITTHKKHPVIARLADQLREYGYNRTAEEINTRIKNLKCFYNRIKKDIEVGIIGEPTWKHFRAMERIMTRPIFSVRPNEIPKPSPRFKMEGLSEGLAGGHTERRHGKENHCKLPASYAEEHENESFYDEDEDDELFTQEMYEAEMDCDMEDFRSDGETMTPDGARGPLDSPIAPMGVCEVKHEVDDDKDASAENGLIVPKDEPIDVDTEESTEQVTSENGDADEANEIFPKLSAYLQLSNNNNQTTTPPTKSSNKVTTTVAGNTPTSTSDTNSTNTAPIKVGQPMMLAQQQSQQGKISLVPTNILLKPPQQQIQLRPQAQHILYNPGLAGNPGIATSGTTATMPNGMKVILVNTLPKNGVGSVSSGAETHQKLITTNAMKANCITSTVPNLGEGRNKPVEMKYQKPPIGGGAGFRTLISNLITIQTQNLEVSRQRLEVERQRLDFEKSIAERILAVLPKILTPPAQAAPDTPNATTTDTPPTIEDPQTPTMPLLTPKIEKED